MHKAKVYKIWISAFLLAALGAGCGDADKNGNAGTASAPTTPPTVLSVTPLNASTGVCPNNGVVISATFSKAMNPATIDTTTFTVTGSGGASIAGAVTYITTTDVATFTPSGALTASTTYTATITTGAKDNFGNALAANFVWTFTTSPTCPPPGGGGGGGGGLALGAACTFGILAATPVVSSVGPTNVTGDVGVWPAASITGFPPGTITGAFHQGDAVAQSAQGALTTAYNNAAGAAGGAVLTADIGGQTLAPGVYKTTSAQPSLGITGILHLSGPASGVWIFQIVSSLTTAVGPGASQVLMSGGATSHNVFWQVGSSATLGGGSTFAGTVMAKASITLGTGAVLNGRALAETGQVTLDSNPVNVPPCP